MLRKNKKYIFNRRHSSNDDELPILHAQNANTSEAPENASAIAPPQSARRSLSLFENGESEASSEFQLQRQTRPSEPENLSHSSPALLNDLKKDENQNRPVPVSDEATPLTPPPLPPRRPPPRSTSGSLSRQVSTRNRFSVLTRPNNSISPVEPSVVGWPPALLEQTPASVIRNVDGLMSIIDYGPPRQNENSDPSASSSSAWRRILLNSRTLQEMSQFDDPPPTYEEAMQAKEREKQNEEPENENAS